MTSNHSIHHWFYEATFLAFLTLFCLCISVGRDLFARSVSRLWLNWNLFLAFVPWCVSSMLVLHKGLWRRKWMVMFALLIWLAFFPNAPYILTDLMHLRSSNEESLWFDLLMFLSFAWTGLLYGFFSLWDIEEILRSWMGSACVTVFSMFLLFLTGFGVYLGRYLRWNTWDLVTSPQRLLNDIGDRLLDPFSHPTTWGMTIFMGVFLNILYFSFRLLRNRGRIFVAPEEKRNSQESKK